MKTNTINKRVLCLVFLTVFTFSFGCSQKKSHSEGDGPVFSAAGPSYPHPDGWADAAVHGGWITAMQTTAPCLICHKTESDQVENTPTCFSCHTLYPHEDGWETSDKHGTFTTANGQQLCATSCHGTNLAGGLSGVGCTSCHQNFPHPTGWSDPTSHGQFVNDEGLSMCSTSCHGTDLSGGTSNVACTSCHPLYPHTDNWDAPTNHGIYVDNNGEASCQTTCHGSDLSGGLSGVGCTTCHDLYPHSSNWADVTEHGVYVVNNNAIETCKTSCHGTDLLGGTSGTSCNSCHSLYPHADQWVDVTNHGVYVDNNTDTTCKTTCHGTDLSGGLSNISCQSCHDLYPHITNWADSAQHGAYVNTNTDATCRTQCHGTDLTGGISGVACGTPACHAGFPHVTGWSAASSHGTFVVNNGLAGCQTTCHGTDFLGGTSGVSCKDVACHPNYPHTDANWTADNPDSVHGDLFIAGVLGQPSIPIPPSDPAICQECHGVDYNRTFNGQSCITAPCHATGITHTPTWEDNAVTGHGKFYSTTLGLDSLSINTPCQDCHTTMTTVVFDDSQSKADLANSSYCYNCHWAYPHIGYDVPPTYNWLWDQGVGYTSADAGHIYHLMNNDLVTSSVGIGYTSPNDPTALTIPAVENTCGGTTTNNCHKDGFNAEPNVYCTSNLCATYCHQP